MVPEKIVHHIVQVKAKTITEIHSEAEKNLGLHPGATASMRNNRNVASGPQRSISPGGLPINRPGAGGMMLGMPGTRKMPGPFVAGGTRYIIHFRWKTYCLGF